ncbi:MAG: ABC transporter permease [Candidatus Promineifilaceae bacterium]|nr:ABC transporter permease [Candidatus Promineifilaceae bacterium]
MEGLEVFENLAELVMLALVPYVLASQGTMIAGRTGIFNVAQEGIMLVGASIGFLAAFLLGSLWYGLLIAALAGGLFGLILAYFTATLKMDQFVIGLALFFTGLGFSTLAFKVVVGVTLQPPLIPTLQAVPIPLLHRIPILGPILFEQNVLVYFSIILSLLLYYFLFHTRRGLELRAVGENPKAADSLGVPVARLQYATTIFGSMLMGLAGAYLPMVYSSTFTEGIVQGRGWLAIALTFFGGWRPDFIFLGALFFAAVEVLALRVQVAGGILPYQFLLTLPYITTILVMIFAFRWARVPAFLGMNYDREQRSL